MKKIKWLNELAADIDTLHPDRGITVTVAVNDGMSYSQTCTVKELCDLSAALKVMGDAISA